jgi:hypothetical protein
MKKENGMSSSADKSIREVNNSDQEIINHYNISSDDEVVLSD